jgi:hypothetical protein
MQLESLLLEDPEIAFRARQFMYLYNLLDEQFSGDTAAMAHWIRRKKCVSGYYTLAGDGRSGQDGRCYCCHI